MNTTTPLLVPSPESKNKLTLKTYKHIFSYPVVKEVTGLFTQYSWISSTVQSVQDFLMSVLAFLSGLGIIVACWNYIDSTLDSSLDFFDKNVPFVANFSFVSLWKTVVNYCNSLIAAVNARFNAVVKSLQPRIHAIIKSFDPILKVTNDYYEYILNSILPNTLLIKVDSKFGKLHESTEFDRMLHLMNQTFTRINLTASNVSKLPSHVSNTYRNELKETKSTTQAVSKTTRKLSNDAYNTIKPTIDKVYNYTANTANGAAEKITEPIINVTESVAAATGVEVH